MHNRHLAGCGVMLTVAIGFLVLSGGSSAGVGVMLVALVCPLAMILGVKLLMGDQQRVDPDRSDPSSAAHHGGSPR